MQCIFKNKKVDVYWISKDTVCIWWPEETLPEGCISTGYKKYIIVPKSEVKPAK